MDDCCAEADLDCPDDRLRAFTDIAGRRRRGARGDVAAPGSRPRADVATVPGLP